MEHLPVEILAYIVSYADLVTIQIFRTTCRTLNHYIPQYLFVYRNAVIEQLDAIDQQMAQRVSARISVDFRDPPLRIRLQALTIIKMISKYVNITSLNILDLTSAITDKHVKDTRLLMLTSLTNLEQLAIKMHALQPILTHFSSLTKLTVSQFRFPYYEDPPDLSEKRKNLCDLTLLDCDFFYYNAIDGLTKLHIEMGQGSTIRYHVSMATTLKQLTVIPYTQSDYPTLEPNQCRALESVKVVTQSIPSEIALNTNLTRLEIRCEERGCDLNTLSALTRLQYLDLTVKRATTPVSFTFLAKLPLRSAQLSIAKLDNTLSIQHFNADKLHHLGLEIDVNSKYKDHLARLTALDSLTLTATKLQSVTLPSFIRLTRLKLHHVQCGSVAPFTNLKFLSVVGNQRAVAGLNTLTNLEQLHCALKPTELSYLSSLTQLQNLHLIVKGSMQSNVLVRLTRLTYLIVSTNNFPSIASLTSLTRLDHLDIISCAIKPEEFKLLTALSRLTQLKANCVEPSTDVLGKLTRLQRIQLAPFQHQPQGDYKERLMKNLPHFIALKINLEVEYDY